MSSSLIFAPLHDITSVYLQFFSIYLVYVIAGMFHLERTERKKGKGHLANKLWDFRILASNIMLILMCTIVH
jgi:hypothetical protein